MELATAFKCNVSQLSKALTGFEYRSSPHHYKPKPKSVKKRTSELGEPSNMPPTKTSAVTETTAKPAQAEHLLAADDTLETDSSSSDLPPGL